MNSICESSVNALGTLGVLKSLTQQNYILKEEKLKC